MNCRTRCKVPAKKRGIRFTIEFVECKSDGTKPVIPVLGDDVVAIYLRPKQYHSADEIVEIPATLLTNGTDGKVTATTTETTIDRLGTWLVWGMITRTIGAEVFEWPSQPHEFEVFDNWPV